MAYFLNLFSPETYEAFSRSDRTVSGFRMRQQKSATKIKLGDKLICYMTKISRWFGILEVVSPAFEDSSPIFMDNDPFVVRFQVKPLVWLDKEYAIPIHEDHVWNTLSFTKNHDKKSSIWTGHIRSSLAKMETQDGSFLEKLITQQTTNGQLYPLTDRENILYTTHTVRRLDKTVTVSVPQDQEEQQEDIIQSPMSAPIDLRESYKIQALVAKIGATMGMNIWLPRADRGPVCSEWTDYQRNLIDILPLNYDEVTLKTIEKLMYFGYVDDQLYEHLRLSIQHLFTLVSCVWLIY
jgi:predicted RNA-binding protein